MLLELAGKQDRKNKGYAFHRKHFGDCFPFFAFRRSRIGDRSPVARRGFARLLVLHIYFSSFSDILLHRSYRIQLYTVAPRLIKDGTVTHRMSSSQRHSAAQPRPEQNTADGPPAVRPAVCSHRTSATTAHEQRPAKPACACRVRCVAPRSDRRFRHRNSRDVDYRVPTCALSTRLRDASFGFVPVSEPGAALYSGRLRQDTICPKQHAPNPTLVVSHSRPGRDVTATVAPILAAELLVYSLTPCV